MISSEAQAALEFPFVRKLLAELTVTPMGSPLAQAVRPLDGPAEIGSSLDEVAETLRLLEAEGPLPLRGIRPIAEILGRARPEGSVLTGREIVDVVAFAAVVEGVRASARRLAGDWPRLGAMISTLPDLGGLVRAVAGKLAPSGDLEDGASPVLARARARIQSTTATLRRTLESILARSDAGKFLSDAFVTERGGRFVIPVRSDSPTAPKGIVHGGSSSGATLFVEPLATVELNNELVQLREEEQAEVERILREWTGLLRDRAPAIEGA